MGLGESTLLVRLDVLRQGRMMVIFGGEALDGQLEEDMIVALAGAAWAMASRPSFLAISTRRLPMRRAKAVAQQ